MSQPSSTNHSSGNEPEQQRYSNRRPSQYSSTNLSLGVIAGLLLVIPAVIFLRKGYLSQQQAAVERPVPPVEMTKSVASIIPARALPPYNEKETEILHNAYGDPVGTLFDYELPGKKSIRIPRGGFEEQLLSALNADEIEHDRFYILDRLYFAPGSTDLNAESQEQIRATAAILQANPVLRIQLRGHTDNTGKEETNQELSNERARSVMVALIKQGVLPLRIAIRGMGSDEPVADNDTEEGKQRNRRIDLSIVRSVGYGPRIFSY